jgi:chromosome partitioning protein
MASHVLTIAQQKGGAGKTTLAAQLGVAFLALGRQVALVDIDPQASLATWHKARRDFYGDGATGITLSDVPGWKLATEIDKLKRDHDLIIVDSPPHAETDARVAIRAAQLILVPVQPSPLDLWATKPTLELARKEKAEALIVINRIPPRGRLPEAMLAKLAAEQLPLAKAMLGNRVAFAASMLDGRGVLEVSPRPSAADEIMALAKEVAKALKMKL